MNEGGKELHDDLIVQKAHEIAGQYDVLVFAQATMVDAADRCADMKVPVLTSVESGIKQLDQYLS